MTPDTPTSAETFEEKCARNARVQARYDELMAAGKHGHYETMFRVVREEVERARASPAAAAETAQPATPEPAEDVQRLACALEANALSIDFAGIAQAPSSSVLREAADMMRRLATQPATHVALTDEQIDALVREYRGRTYPQDMHPHFERALVRAALATQAAQTQQPKDVGDAATRPGLSVAGAPTIPIAAGEVQRAEPVISARTVQHGATFGVELFITGLGSEEHAQRACDLLLQQVAGEEIKGN